MDGGSEDFDKEWLSNHWFRFGAISLANDILMQLQKEADGHYQSAYHFGTDWSTASPYKSETRLVIADRRASERGRSCAPVTFDPGNDHASRTVFNPSRHAMQSSKAAHQ